MSGIAPTIGAAGKVRLYFFEDYDFELDQVVRSKRPATMEFIERFHLQPVTDYSVEVDSSQVDAFGLLAGDS
jgi:hypothetical protein